MSVKVIQSTRLSKKSREARQQELSWGTPEKKILFVVPNPPRMRAATALYPALDIIKQVCRDKGWYVDDYVFRRWRQPRFSERGLLVEKFDVIAFSIYFTLQHLNIIPIMNQLNSDAIKIAGGFSCHNPQPFKALFDTVVIGEGEQAMSDIIDMIDGGEELPPEIWATTPKKELNTPIILRRGTNGRAYIETVRGCKTKCKFCQLSWLRGGQVEKPLELIKRQFDWCAKNRVRTINIGTPNFLGHSETAEIFDYCKEKKFYVTNSDVRVSDLVNKQDLLKGVRWSRSVKVGVESYTDEALRYCAKGHTREMIDQAREICMEYYRAHFMFIYGLPKSRDEDLIEFVKAAEVLKKKVKHAIQVSYSFNNFMPGHGTPFEGEAIIDFEKKAPFIKEFKDTHARGWTGRHPGSYFTELFLLNHQGDLSKLLKQLGANYYYKDNLDPEIYEKIVEYRKYYNYELPWEATVSGN